jgi:hypothetical protein
MRNRRRRESMRVGALVLLLTVVGVAGGAWTDEAAAQERLMLSRTPPAVDVDDGVPGGRDMLIAVSALQFLGLIVVEATAYMRRRTHTRTVIRPLGWRVPTPDRSPALGSTSRTPRAA